MARSEINKVNRGVGPTGEVFVDTIGCHRLVLSNFGPDSWRPHFLVRTLLTRSETHVTFYRSRYQRPGSSPRNSIDAYVFAPVTVQLLRGKAPINVIIDSLLECDNLPPWVEKRLKKLATSGA